MTGTSVKHHYAGGPGARYWLLGSALFLSTVGLVMIYSASSVKALAETGHSWQYLMKQGTFIAVGWVIAIAVARFDYRRLRESWLVIWLGAVGLLFAVVFIGFASHGAQRWIPLGFFNLQPSELAKAACILAVAATAVEWRRGRLDDGKFMTRVFVLAGVPSILIIFQPDMGTTFTLIVAVTIVLILAGISLRWVFAAGAGLVALGAVFILSSPYRMDRVTGFLNPWADPRGTGYQTIQALYAFGSGGITGVGLGLSRQKWFYLPEAHTDFVLAVIGEEIGLIGTLMVVAGFCLFVWAGFRIATGARDDFGRLLAGGLTAMLGVQACLNMAAVTGMMPVTGKTLPFVSYGGSSMLATMLALGVLLSVSEYGARAPRAVRTQAPREERVRESTRDRRRDGGTHLPRADRGRAHRRRA